MKTKHTLFLIGAMVLAMGTAGTTVMASEAKEAHYPVTITTYNYNHEPIEETFDKAPEKVCAYANSNIEAMLKMGLGDKIVMAWGLDGEVSEDLKAEFTKLNYLEEWPSREEVLAAEPDFITAWYSSFAEDRLSDVSFWQERDVNTYMSLNSSCMGSSDVSPREIKWEMQDILNLGMIFDCEEKAQGIVDEMQEEITKIQDYVKDQKPVTLAILENEGDSFRVYGKDVLGGDIAVTIGATLAIGAENSENVSAEDLIAANPNVLVMVNFEGFKTEEEAIKDITENPAYASLAAVQNQKVFSINLNEIYCSGIRTYDGILDFAKALYPELYQ